MLKRQHRCDWLPASKSSDLRINCESYSTIKVHKCKNKIRKIDSRIDRLVRISPTFCRRWPLLALSAFSIHLPNRLSVVQEPGHPMIDHSALSKAAGGGAMGVCDVAHLATASLVGTDPPLTLHKPSIARTMTACAHQRRQSEKPRKYSGFRLSL